VRAKRETQEEKEREREREREQDREGKHAAGRHGWQGWLVEPFVFYLRVSPPKSGWKNGVKG